MKRENTELEMKVKNGEKKIKPNISNYICPNFLMSERNKFAKYIIKAEEILKKKMSYDNIFRHLIEHERLKKILLSEEQFVLMNNLPKVKVDAVITEPVLQTDELNHKLHLINMNRQDKINRKLLKFFDER